MLVIHLCFRDAFKLYDLEDIQYLKGQSQYPFSGQMTEFIVLLNIDCSEPHLSVLNLIELYYRYSYEVLSIGYCD